MLGAKNKEPKSQSPKTQKPKKSLDNMFMTEIISFRTQEDLEVGL